MRDRIDRRTFLRIAGLSLGAGALYRVGAFAGAEGQDAARALGRATGEAPAPFTFVQLSDPHVGFSGPPNPTGTQAFERAVAEINALPQRPDLVLFTGDLSHESEKPGEHAARMARFREIAGRLRVPAMHAVPGEHDAGLDGGALFRSFFGETSYSFDHKGVHFVALDNVSRAKPEVGPERRDWLRRDLARFPRTAPIVVFTHRPLFDLRPDWEWFTRDGDQVMALLEPFENVTVLYGHIHREDVHRAGHATHYAARSLIFAFPDPATTPEKKPIPFDPARPFRNLGLRRLDARREGGGGLAIAPTEVELTLRKLSGTEGFAQLLRPSSL
ncbi:metallophosphoesterase family protein [Anaeromyxobacter paludicola]|uniref:Serine/threonine protein phosphatase n=1 Tax=Anaeromyxobacter paludicola TaxID=2918171 RepID=A0ABM7XCF7_9BACT|nr:metallophosphoesterase [Anaeromyxobacter paludicola]BDG09509.1 serine/threonine protein phosphatase [Anaeromyxobacter paludicola]